MTFLPFSFMASLLWGLVKTYFTTTITMITKQREKDINNNSKSGNICQIIVIIFVRINSGNNYNIDSNDK